MMSTFVKVFWYHFLLTLCQLNCNCTIIPILYVNNITFMLLCHRLYIRKVMMSAKQSTHAWLIPQKWNRPRKTFPIEVM